MSEMHETLNMTYKMKAAETTLNKYCCAVLDSATDGQVTRPAGANAGNIAGVLRDESHAAGAYANYQVAGLAYVMIASAVAIGDLLVIADAAGRVASAGSGAHASGIGKVGRAQSAGTTAGDIIKVLLEIPCEYSS